MATLLSVVMLLLLFDWATAMAAKGTVRMTEERMVIIWNTVTLLRTTSRLY